MNRLRTTLSSDAGRFIHLGIFAVLAVLTVNHLIVLPFLIAEAVYLWQSARRIFAAALFLTAVIGIRFVLIATEPAFTQTSFAGTVTAVESGRITVRTGSQKIYVYHKLTTVFVPGDTVEISGRTGQFEPQSIEHGFNDRRYLKAIGITGSMFATEITITGRKFALGIIPFRLKAYAASLCDGPAAMMIGLFVFGDSGYMPADLVAASAELGISHVFAISGMHVGVIALFLEAFLKRLHLGRTFRAIAVAAILGFYTLVTGGSVSVVRAVALYVAAIVGHTAKLPFSTTDLMAFVLIAVLIVNPFSLFLIGFQLSYLIAFAIVLGSELIADQAPIRRLLKIGLLANAVALPILLELNGAFNFTGIPANLVFVLFVEKAAMPLSFFTLFVPPAEPLLDLAGSWFATAIRTVSAYPLLWQVNFASEAAKTAYWTMAFWALIRLSRHRRIIMPCALAVLIAFLGQAFPELPGVTTVQVFDVGQGDAIYLSDGNCRMLIDTGPADDYDQIFRYFQRENIRSLDWVVLTHGHDDHIGEIADLDRSLSISQIGAAADLCPACQANKRLLAAGNEIVCGSLSFVVLAAGDPAENDGSIVLYGTVGSDRWLLMGDAEAAGEANFVIPAADVIKIGHHGSVTSTTAAFLTVTAPDIAVISVGRTNRYGHPDASVLAAIGASGAEIYRTDQMGTITFTYPPGGGRIISKRSEDDLFENVVSRILDIELPLSVTGAACYNGDGDDDERHALSVLRIGSESDQNTYRSLVGRNRDCTLRRRDFRHGGNYCRWRSHRRDDDPLPVRAEGRDPPERLFFHGRSQTGERTGASSGTADRISGPSEPDDCLHRSGEC